MLFGRSIGSDAGSDNEAPTGAPRLATECPTRSPMHQIGGPGGYPALPSMRCGLRDDDRGGGPPEHAMA
jgi:hypothetical protein